MSAIAAIFRSAHEADAAYGELTMRGVTGVSLQPCSDVHEHLVSGGSDPELRKHLFLTASPSLLGDPGHPISPQRDMMMMSRRDGMPLRPTILPDGRQSLQSGAGEGDCTLVLVEGVKELAIIRTILETNGAELVRVLPPETSSPPETTE